jgi:hypothetical protein
LMISDFKMFKSVWEAKQSKTKRSKAKRRKRNDQVSSHHHCSIDQWMNIKWNSLFFNNN